MIFTLASISFIAIQDTYTPEIPPSILNVSELCQQFTKAGIPLKTKDSIADRILVLSLRPKPWRDWVAFAERGLGLEVSESKDGWILSESKAFVKERRSLLAAYDDLHLGRYRSGVKRAWQLYNEAVQNNVSKDEIENFVARRVGQGSKEVTSVTRILLDSPNSSTAAAAALRSGTVATSESLTTADFVESFDLNRLANDPDPVVRQMANIKIPKLQFNPSATPEAQERYIRQLNQRKKVVLRLSLAPLSETLESGIDIQFGARAGFVMGGYGSLCASAPDEVPKLSDIFRQAKLGDSYTKRTQETKEVLTQPWARSSVSIPSGTRSLSLALITWSRQSQREVAMWSPGCRDLADPFLTSVTQGCSLAQLLDPKPAIQDVDAPREGLSGRWIEQSLYYRYSQIRGSSWTTKTELGVCVIRDERAFLDGFVEHIGPEMAAVINNPSAPPSLEDLVKMARKVRRLPVPITAFNDVLGISVLPCLRALSGFTEAQIRTFIRLAEKDGEVRISLAALPPTILRKAYEDAVACSKLLKLERKNGSALAKVLEHDYAASWKISTLILKPSPLPSGTTEWTLTVVAPQDEHLDNSILYPISFQKPMIPLWSGNIEASRML